MAELPDGPLPSRATAGLSEAAAQNSQYLLLGDYSTTPKDFTLRLELYDVATSRLIRESTASGRIGLSLDSVVEAVLDTALAGIEFRPVAAPETAARIPAPAIPTVGGTGVPVAGPSSGRKIFAITSGAAPFITMGDASAYASLGILATLSADFRFPLGPGVLGAGVLSGACVLDAAGVVAAARLIIVPIGADLFYSMNEGGFPGIVIHLSGGPALINVDSDYSGSLTKAIPYLLAGLSLDLPFSRSFGLAVDVDWAAFLESASFLIMAFAPEVSVYVRF
jgi:hypothetical protein